jgi:hypothetical protein
MRHVDEGSLHAYLDGGLTPVPPLHAVETGPEGEVPAQEEIEQHLAQCAQCRARLEEARRLRDRAARILDGSGPASIRVPPFDSLRETADRATLRRRRLLTLTRLKALGVAASIVLAVAVGWWARGSLQDSGQPTAVRGASGGSLTVAVTPVDTAARTAAMPDAAARLGSGADAAGAPPREPATRPSGARAQLPIEEAPKGARQQRPLAPLQAIAERAADARAAQAREAAPIAAAEFAAPPEPVREIVIEAWTAADAETAGEYLGIPVLTVPELTVLSYSVGRVDGNRAVRVLQELKPGDMLELIQRTAEGDRPERRLMAARALAPVFTDSLVTVRVFRDGYVITARARVTEESLRELLERIR